MSLDDIGLRHGTDKASSHHDYLRIYESQIPIDRKGRLLELGWLDGASVRMWREWLPHWDITGLDNEPKQPIPDINFVLGSQDDPGAIGSVVRYGPFDVIIDDASHEVVRTTVSFRLLWPSVKPGGLYFIEDLGTAFLEHWGGSTENFHTMIENVVNDRADIEQISFWRNLCMVRKANG